MNLMTYIICTVLQTLHSYNLLYSAVQKGKLTFIVLPAFVSGLTTQEGCQKENAAPWAEEVPPPLGNQLLCCMASAFIAMP